MPLAAIVLVRRPDGRVLAVSRGVDVDLWGLPGGRLEQGETLAQCAARELLEETGLALRDPVEVFRAPSPGGFVTAAFIGAVSGTPRGSPEGDIRWVQEPNGVRRSSVSSSGYTRKLYARIGMAKDDASAHQFDLGLGDVSTPGGSNGGGKRFTPTRTPDVMATITAAERKKLKPSQFADPKNRRYPIHDKKHADDAASRLEGNKADEPSYAAIKRRIVAAQSRFGEGKKKTSSAAMRSGGRGLRMSIKNPDGSGVEIRHMAAYVEKTDRLYLTFPLDKSAALAAGDKVWIQIGRVGRWLGHPQGPFQLNAQIFDTLVHNFKTQGQGRIQYDFDHASEMPPTQGSIPTEGVPAQGWIYELKHDGQGLFALTEWKGKAREYIQNDQYQGVSPSIYWKCKDRESGAPIGPMLTSVALTNKPFITDMLPLVASDTAATMLASENDADSVQVFSSGYCYSTSEFMPHVKAALRLGAGATPLECSEHLNRLRDKFDENDGDVNMMHDGYMLSDFTTPLRDQFAQNHASTWDDVFDIVSDLIDVAIEEHEIIFHPDGPPDPEEEAAMSAATTASTAAASTETTPSPAEQTTQGDETIMATNEDPKALLATAQTEVQTLSTQLTAANATVTATKAELASKDAKIGELTTEVQTLSAYKTDQEKKVLTARVLEAFETHGAKRKLTEADRDGWMTTMCSMSPEKFEKDFPHVAPQNAHLLQRRTADGRGGTGGVRTPADSTVTKDTAELPEMSFMSLSEKISREEDVPLSLAMIKAEKILAKAEKTHATTARS